ncbi:Ubiquitin carboxyl-terminal hydrolase-related protein [Raphanus sativus]|nr:Ubiquitin carboxyl-terminal hydrolase-related protein [Raphanus sativus]
MLCDTKTGGCGTTNFVHHVMSRCPPIFTIVLEWEKSETEKEISETTKALEWEIDMSRLYEGLEPNTNYRLVSMVGYSEEEEEENICIAYEKNRWVNLRRESLAGEVVGSWKNVVRFCGERMIRPEILFYEAARSMI